MFTLSKLLCTSATLLPLAQCQQIFDYVIVGGGTCGLTVANRLSENPNVSIAVIEAGTIQENNPNVTSWDSFLKAYNTSIDWQYRSANQQYAANQELIYHSGKALGGSSTINGMTYVRAEKAQIDAWELVGNEGWNWNDLYRYYKKSEHFDNATRNQLEVDGVSFIDEYHGFEGPLHVGYPVELSNGSFHRIANATVQALGIPFNPDVNGGHVRGFTLWQSTFDRNADVRADSAREYYLPVRHRPNLHIFSSTTAARVTWNSTQTPVVANGVEIIGISNKSTTIGVRKEVIVSAGSLRSPAFLELSGIGNPKILKKYNIPVTVPLDAVGENLQDQTNVGLAAIGDLNFTGTGPYVAFANISDFLSHSELSSIGSNVTAWAQTVSAANNGYVNATALAMLFQIQLRLLLEDLVPDAEIIITASSNNIVIAHWGLMPFARGSVHVASGNPLEPPLMDPKFFAAEIDVVIQVAIAKLSRSILYTEPMSKIVQQEIAPGQAILPLNATDDQWASYVKNAGKGDPAVRITALLTDVWPVQPNSHPIGSASMLSRELGGVVDSKLKVYGTSNVRIVDASVMPFQVSGHLTSTLYALSEKAADIIKGGL